MNSEYDDRLLSELELEINSNIIKIHGSSSGFFDEIAAHYPTGFSGINWGQTTPILFEKIESSDQIQRQAVINHFLEDIIVNLPELQNEVVVVAGDNLINLAFEMKYKDFISVNMHFFSIPQHTYIWFTQSKKCLNLTFEDEIFFG